MELRADATEFVPRLSNRATIGDFLIQNLAENIMQTSKPAAPQKNTAQRSSQRVARPTLQPCKFSQNLLPSGIFCPWCTARVPCAFHLPEFESTVAGELLPLQTEEILSSRHSFDVDQRMLPPPLPPPGLAPQNVLPQPVREQCIAQKTHDDRMLPPPPPPLGLAPQTILPQPVREHRTAEKTHDDRMLPPPPPPLDLAPQNVIPQPVREQCTAQNAHDYRCCTKHTRERLHGESKSNALQWLNGCIPEKHFADDESASTDLNCSEACYAESEHSDNSIAIDNSPKLHERQQERNIVWARGSKWGVASRKHGLY